MFENQQGEFYAGSGSQNFNTKIALTGSPYVFIQASVTELNSGIEKISEPVLFKCYQTDPCSVVLPTGINLSYGAPTYRSCNRRGITTSTISQISGGKGFAIGDKLNPVGGGGYGAEIQIVSGGITSDSFSSFVGGSGFNIGDYIAVTGGGGTGGLIQISSGGITNQSINNLNGCSGFKVGDLFTTVGGGGSDAVIRVTATGVNGSISGFNVINPGHGYLFAPNNVLSLTGSGSCANATFNADNFTIFAAGGITSDSVKLNGGSGYNIGEILNIVGGGGSGAQTQVISGSLTSDSINSLGGGSGYVVGDLLTTTGGGGSDVVIRITSVGVNGAINGWEILNVGYGFTSAPTGLSKLTGVGTGASINANSDNFSLTASGAITSSSISNLVGSGSGFVVGDKIVLSGGGGSGAVIQITGVDSNGKILSYAIINGGMDYASSPSLQDINGTALNLAVSLTPALFAKPSFVIIDQGTGYLNNPTSVVSQNGNGSGLTASYLSSSFTDPAFTVINSGSGYVSAPTGIQVVTGNGSAITTSFNASNFTIPASGGITVASISGLIGSGPGYTINQILTVSGGGGSGASIKITSVDNNGNILSYIILSNGSGYSDQPPTQIITSTGSIVSGASLNSSLFTSSAITVTDPGSGYVSEPTGLSIKTGYGQLDTVAASFNDYSFIEITGPAPSPSPTPTNSPTPSPSIPASCNDLQTAGGQNNQYIITVVEAAVSGQNYLIVKDSPALQKHTVIDGTGLTAGTSIVSVENFFANYDNRVVNKKINLDTPLSSNINANSLVTAYTTDIRIIKTSYWPGTMNFVYDAYTIPDRFKVIALSDDPRKPDILLFDSGYRGGDLCGYATVLAGIGSGSATLSKPEGYTYVKVITEAPCAGTAWEYSLSCPTRTYTTFTSTPTRTPTQTPTPSPSRL